MTQITDLEDENTYKNNLGRENRSAIKRSIIMALMAAGAVAAALLIAPPVNPTTVNLGGSDRTASTAAAPAAALEPTDPSDGSLLPTSISQPRERFDNDR